MYDKMYTYYYENKGNFMHSIEYICIPKYNFILMNILLTKFHFNIIKIHTLRTYYIIYFMYNAICK